MRPFLIATSLLAGIMLQQAAAQPVREHRLTIAANSALRFSNDEADAIIGQINGMLASRIPGQAWDEPCMGVRFTRQGNVISLPGLPQAGSHEQQVAALRRLAPAANLLLTSSITCGTTIGAAGCNMIGAEPTVVRTIRGMNAQLWLHERGHAVGLNHSAEANNVTTEPSIVLRFMYFELGLDRTGKVALDCGRFRTSSLPSIHSVPPSAAVDPGGATLIASPPAALQQLGVTQAVWRLLETPWLHDAPQADIAALTADDLASIRRLLAADPRLIIPYLSQAQAILGARGEGDDISLIGRSITSDQFGQMAASLPPEDVRDLLNAQLTAPLVLGQFANRTQSNEAVRVITRAAGLARARVVIGDESAAALSVNALTGLAMANTPLARTTLSAAITNTAADTPLRSAVISDLREAGPQTDSNPVTDPAPLSEENLAELRRIVGESSRGRRG